MLIKTDKGRTELLPGHRSLGQRERAILLVADGRKSTDSLNALFHGEGRAMVEALLADGYLIDEAPAAPPARPVPPPPRGSVDTFSGPRSLASARMFLFDLSDRMFAARDRALADRFRQALREARDAASMLAVGQDMLTEIERVAGAERAASISERLAKVLPETTPQDA
ncbi:MAG: hypothetical protein ABS53_12995 [Hydrogenophaga sp. SCN 70-13]|nr:MULTISPECIES: hypothetical protein [unclassified Hydrogenophaga]MBN9372918.1 hypothetical protein [Hydrogenophaga sp.]ODT29802.1 MAG: hypothetical protein ABS53_12995 [Hydrogenophaga sp. SCN 70-13]OJV43566.1 MAG: hypothetical protein BGO22_03610 [Hydrogenophaga sp. 70-12]